MVVHRNINSGPLVLSPTGVLTKGLCCMYLIMYLGSFVYDQNICMKSCGVSFFRRRVNGNSKQCSGHALWAYFKIELCRSRRRLIWWTAFMCMYCAVGTFVRPTCVLIWNCIMYVHQGVLIWVCLLGHCCMGIWACLGMILVYALVNIMVIYRACLCCKRSLEHVLSNVSILVSTETIQFRTYVQFDMLLHKVFKMYYWFYHQHNLKKIFWFERFSYSN